MEVSHKEFGEELRNSVTYGRCHRLGGKIRFTNGCHRKKGKERKTTKDVGGWKPGEAGRSRFC